MVSNQLTGISGQLAGIHLSSFLQMIEMEQKTCIIKVFTKNDSGKVFFLKGNLIDAQTSNLRHIDALYAILSWENTILELGENRSKTEDAINLPLMHILMESAQYTDETKQTGTRQEQKRAPQKNQRRISLKTELSRDFCLEIGVRVLVDFDEWAISLDSVLVGIEQDKYLLLKAPDQLNGLENELLNGGNLTVKSLYKGTIYAFRSQLLAVIYEPSQLMFIEYPQQIEHHELRSQKRYRCSIVAQAQVDNKERSGVIENISKGGCRCVMELFSADERLETQILNDTITFRCCFPGSKQEIRFKGQVKNAMGTSGELAVGVKFVGIDEVKETINEYIRLIEYSSENV